MGWESLNTFCNRFKKKILDVFSEEHLREVAKEVGFMKRKSKLTPEVFFELVLLKKMDGQQVSLNDHCTDLMLNSEVEIKKQSLHERFNESSVNYIKRLVEDQLNNQITEALDIDIFQAFTSVKLKDSVRFQLPEFLKDQYPGSTGGASGSAAHIQFEYDLITGRVTDLNLTSGVCQDTTDASQTVSAIQKGELIIRDLGYFSMDVFEKIQEQEAYYLSRLKPKVHIYSLKEGVFIPIDLVDIQANMSKKGLNSQEIEVYIGANKKLPVRLIIEMLPEQIVAKRLEKAKKEAKKKGRTLSKKYKAYIALNLFITNASEQDLEAKNARSLYRLRWQIELRFKTWKSYCCIHKIKKMNCFRFECYLYSCLLLILINWEIAINFFEIIWKQIKKPLSILKFYKTVIQQRHLLRKVLIENTLQSEDFLKMLYKTSITRLLTEQKKGKLSLEEILTLSIDNEKVK